MDETAAASEAPTTTATTAPPATLSFRVVHAKNTIEVALPQDATVLALVDHLQSVTRVPAETMKLMFKGMHYNTIMSYTMIIPRRLSTQGSLRDQASLNSTRKHLPKPESHRSGLQCELP